MTFQIEIPEPIATAFRAQAMRRGQSAEQFARELIERQTQAEPQGGSFDELLGAMRGRLPKVAAFYAERSDETVREDGESR